MRKQDLIDALRALNVQDEELQGLTISQMSNLLTKIRTEQNATLKPDELDVKVTEITRSYTRKVNLGNYESEDFFCSRKAEVTEDDNLTAVSKWLAYECKIDVEAQMDNKKEKPF